MLTENLATVLEIKRNILLVEDEFTVANNLQIILEKAGYTVTGTAFSVSEALRLLEQQTPDMVLLDIYLQGPQTGIDLARTLMTRQIPFIYISANSNDSIVEEAKMTQPYGFLIKPFRPKDVLIALEMASYRHAHSQEASLRKAKSLQVAVNNALMTLKERNALCREIANQINQLVPFFVFGLCVRSVSGQLLYSVNLHKTPGGLFESQNLAILAADLAIPASRLQADTDALWHEECGIISGKDFEQLCQKYVVYQLLQSHFGCHTLLRLQLPLNNGAPAMMSLVSTQPYGLDQSHHELIQLIIPQITLALENLFAFEEIEAREQVKTAELAIINAFTSTLPYQEIILQVAKALDEIIPCDLFSVYRAGKNWRPPSLTRSLLKKSGYSFPFF